MTFATSRGATTLPYLSLQTGERAHGPSYHCSMVEPIPRSRFPIPKYGEPALHRAARVGNHEEIRSLIESGVPVDDLFDIQLDPAARPRLATPLMVAVGSAD